VVVVDDGSVVWLEGVWLEGVWLEGVWLEGVVLDGEELDGYELDGEVLDGDVLCVELLGLVVVCELVVLCDCELVSGVVDCGELLCATTHTDDSNRIAVIR
jgi:hypothetical protein